MLFRIAFVSLLALMGSALSLAPAMAEVFDVLMLNNDPDNPRKRNLFKPAFLHIKPGDQVRFVSTDLGHNTASIDGLIPSDAESWKSELSKDVTLTFEKEGVYGYKCSPHYALGMVGLIVVGSPDPNEAEFKAKKMPRRAAKKFKKMFKELASEGSN